MAPTLLELADTSSPPEFRGSSLCPFIGRPVVEDTGATAISTAPRLRPPTRYPWKLLENESGVHLLYDQARDPEEQRPLTEDHSDLVKELRALSSALHAGRLAKSPYVLDEDRIEDPQLLERLRELGYVG